MSRILMILTSHNQLGDTGRKTGFWLEEFAAPITCSVTPDTTSP
ncbi:ThiJ/PfpI family protein [Cutibacterium acnes JCM 18916]|nr:ThiJ/PfpI family protein [Cutibacterium acnes JCM 18916]GAE75685.1 ThiJ/PfpI family protein [Cutibacterium acnes JCM 18918]